MGKFERKCIQKNTHARTRGHTHTHTHTEDNLTEFNRCAVLANAIQEPQTSFK